MAYGVRVIPNGSDRFRLKCILDVSYYVYVGFHRGGLPSSSRRAAATLISLPKCALMNEVHSRTISVDSSTANVMRLS